jgi:acetyl esterase/lipase
MKLPEFWMPLLIRALRRGRAFATPDVARAEIAALAVRPRPYAPPRRLGPDVSITAHRRDGWLEYRLTPIDGPTTGSVLYAHGGAWIREIQAPHWRQAAQIAVECRTTVIVPIYALIPFGTAAQAVDGFTRSALEAEERDGPVRLLGDSAGGQIALSVALQLRDEYSLLVPMTVLTSPAVDLSLSNPEIPDVEKVDPWLHAAGLKVFADAWKGELPTEDPRVSPLFGDLRGLGPLCVLTGTRDILNPDARLLVTKAREAGVQVALHEEKGALHVYPFLPTQSGQRGTQTILQALTIAPA